MADVNIKYQGTSIATIDASGSKTLQTSGKYCEGDITVEYTDPEKPTQAKSATPTETAQDITPDSGKVLSKVSVGAIPKTYVGSGVTKKAAATVSPSTSEQTVCASGVYTTGAQKVAAITKNLLAQLDPDFVAANIKKDVDLFGLVGTLEAGGATDGAGEMFYAEITPATSGEVLTLEVGEKGERIAAMIVSVKADTSIETGKNYGIEQIAMINDANIRRKPHVNNLIVYREGNAAMQSDDAAAQSYGSTPDGYRAYSAYNIWNSASVKPLVKFYVTNGSESKYGLLVGAVYDIWVIKG